MAHWLDKHIKAQKHNRKVLSALGKNPAKIQEMAERENWDSPKPPSKKRTYRWV